MKTIQYISDPGHAWAKVKIKELYDLNIAHKISQFSYMRGDYAYLEEDCDLGVYVEALKNKGIEYKMECISNGNKQSRVRNYYRFQFKENSLRFIREN